MYSGDLLHLSVKKEGIYRINYDDLKQNDIFPNRIDLSRLKLESTLFVAERFYAILGRGDRETVHYAFFGDSDDLWEKGEYLLFYHQPVRKTYCQKALDANKGDISSLKYLPEIQYYTLTLGEHTASHLIRTIASEQRRDDTTVVLDGASIFVVSLEEQSLLKSGQYELGYSLAKDEAFSFQSLPIYTTDRTLVKGVFSFFNQDDFIHQLQLSQGGLVLTDFYLHQLPTSLYGVKAKQTIFQAAFPLSHSDEPMMFRLLSDHESPRVFPDFSVLSYSHLPIAANLPLAFTPAVSSTSGQLVFDKNEQNHFLWNISNPLTPFCITEVSTGIAKAFSVAAGESYYLFSSSPIQEVDSLFVPMNI